MSIVGIGTETFLYVNGIQTKNPLKLSENATLLPVWCSISADKVSRLIESDIDFSIAVLNLPMVTSQIRIQEQNEEELAITAWNCQWDCLLMGAIFDCDVVSNLQSDRPIERICESQYLNITNYNFHGISQKPHVLTLDDEKWIDKNYANARSLLNMREFSTAVNSMATYRWHSNPSIQLAIIWTGIEALFCVESEISFRLSLCIALFLSENKEESARLFSEVRNLYKQRSIAVHGSKTKGDSFLFVRESAFLLNKIIRKCVETNRLPNTGEILFK